MGMTRVLFVDDEPLVLRGLEALARRDRRIVAVFAHDAARALVLHGTQELDVVVTDMRMPGMNGLELLEALVRRGCTAKRLLLTGHADEELLVRACKICDDLLAKPCSWTQLVAAIAPTDELPRRLA